MAKKISSASELINPNVVKVIMNKNHDAIYFSRVALPFYPKKDVSEWMNHHTYYKHLGIYGYRAEVLAKITQLKRSALEIAESLEQLRWIENGFTIRIERTEHEAHAIDTPEDLSRALRFLSDKK